MSDCMGNVYNINASSKETKLFEFYSISRNLLNKLFKITYNKKNNEYTMIKTSDYMKLYNKIY